MIGFHISFTNKPSSNYTEGDIIAEYLDGGDTKWIVKVLTDDKDKIRFSYIHIHPSFMISEIGLARYKNHYNPSK